MNDFISVQLKFFGSSKAYAQCDQTVLELTTDKQVLNGNDLLQIIIDTYPKYVVCCE
jgi:hypothetical protein